MKNVMKQAHKITRKIVNKYKVDYKSQLGICMSYLLNNKEEEGMKEEMNLVKRFIEKYKKAFEGEKNVLSKLTGQDFYKSKKVSSSRLSQIKDEIQDAENSGKITIKEKIEIMKANRVLDKEFKKMDWTDFTPVEATRKQINLKGDLNE